MTRWFPIAPGTTVPAAPAVVGGQMTVAKTVPVWNETVLTAGITKTKLNVSSLPYALSLLTEATVATRTSLAAGYVVPSVDMVLARESPQIAAGCSVEVPSTESVLSAFIPSVVAGVSVEAPASALELIGFTPESVGPLSLSLAVPASTLALNQASPAVVGGISVNAGFIDLGVQALEPVYADGLPKLIGSFINSDSTADTSQALTVPTHATGDLLIAVLMWRSNHGGITVPSGWSLHGTYLNSIVISGAMQNLLVYTKTASGSEPASYTWSAVSSVRNCGLMASIRNGSISQVTENYGNATTATISTADNYLNLTAFTWIYAASSGTESYSQAASAGVLTSITDSPKSQARISGGVISSAATITSTHVSDTASDSPNHGGICIQIA